MARLEYVTFRPWREVITGSNVIWELDVLSESFERLPQVFWDGGEGWAEANHFALTNLSDRGADFETVKSLMKHLRAYAQFLEEQQLDWRHFPIRMEHRAIVRFRGDLIAQMGRGSLASSTARSRMSAVIQFYKHAAAHDMLSPEMPMWREKSVVLPFYDAMGFKRSMTQVSTNLSIPNRARPGVRLEDGLVLNHTGFGGG